ncbi:MAG: hypothetical protein ACM3SW_03640 [Actinomycetota bacterium]
MARKICKIVLLSLLLMAVLSPLLQLNSCDRFPVFSDDIEALITYCLCSFGMSLVLTRVLKLIAVLSRAIVPFLLPASLQEPFVTYEGHAVQCGPELLLIPLRI